MWTKRPRGQIAKCAAAQALRVAFPEIASAPTAEEMEGKTIHLDEPTDAGDGAPRPDLGEWITKARATKTDAEAAAVWAEGGAAIAKTKNRRDYDELKAAVLVHRTALKDTIEANTIDAEPSQPKVDDPFVYDMEEAEGGAR